MYINWGETMVLVDPHRGIESSYGDGGAASNRACKHVHWRLKKSVNRNAKTQGIFTLF
jgi:metallophosphoesterase superfamily enzyme